MMQNTARAVLFFAPSVLLFHLDILVAMPWTARTEPRIDETVEVAVEHPLRVARADAGAEILHHLVRLKNVAANLAAPADFAFFTVELVHLGPLLVLLFLVQPGLENIERRGAVLDLRAFVLADHDNT